MVNEPIWLTKFRDIRAKQQAALEPKQPEVAPTQPILNMNIVPDMGQQQPQQQQGVRPADPGLLVPNLQPATQAPIPPPAQQVQQAPANPYFTTEGIDPSLMAPPRGGAPVQPAGDLIAPNPPLKKIPYFDPLTGQMIDEEEPVITGMPTIGSW